MAEASSPAITGSGTGPRHHDCAAGIDARDRTRERGQAKSFFAFFRDNVDGGMLPNNFPDAGGKPEYNTVDAALWYFEAVRQYFAATQDTRRCKKLYPILDGMIDAHVAGTRFNIHVDPADGLLYAGGPRCQLTWMDAKVGDWVVTPRTGKPRGD